CPDVAAVMQADRVDVTAFGTGVKPGARAHRQTMANLDVRELLDAGAQRGVEDVGLTESRAVVEPHAGSDETGGTLSGNRLRGRAGGSHRHVAQILHPGDVPERR